MITSVIIVIINICWVTYLVPGAVTSSFHSQWIWRVGRSTPNLRWRIWRDADVPDSDGEHWYSHMCGPRSYALSTLPQHDDRRCFRMAFSLCLTGYPEDVAVTRKLPCQSPEMRIPVTKMSQDKALHNLSSSKATLKALWHCPGAGGRWKCPQWITLLGIFVIKTGPKWIRSEMEQK